MTRKIISKNATTLALSFAATVAFSSIASADEVQLLPEKSIAGKLHTNGFLELAQAQETAAEKAARKQEERRVERERKKAERARKRKERKKNRPRFGSFS